MMKRRDFLKTTAAAAAIVSMGSVGQPAVQQTICNNWTWNPLDEQWERLDDWRELNFLRRTIQDPKPNEPHFIANLIGQPIGFRSRAVVGNEYHPFEKQRYGVLIHSAGYTSNVWAVPNFTFGFHGEDPRRNSWKYLEKDIQTMKETSSPRAKVCLFMHNWIQETSTQGFFVASMIALR